jgi:hypothetical protein
MTTFSESEVLFNLGPEITSFMDTFGTKVTLPDGRIYFCMPYWFSPDKKYKDRYRAFLFDELPREVKYLATNPKKSK